MESEPDGDNKFILNYQDCLTRFMVLRPLKTKTADEVVDVIVDIFCLLGAPSILLSNDDHEFCKEMSEALKVKWKDVTVVPLGGSSVDLTKQDVRDSLTVWMKDNDTSRWASGLRFVQMSKNRSYHTDIKKTPHEALFRDPPRSNLSDTPVDNRTPAIKTEIEEEDTAHSSEVTVVDSIKVENDSLEEDDLETVSSPMDVDQWYPKLLYPEVKITPD